MNRFSVEKSVYKVLSPDSVGLFVCNQPFVAYEVPKEVIAPTGQRYNIIKIMKYAFSGSSIKFLSFPEDSCVVEIEDDAFIRSNMASIVLPPKLRIIGEHSLINLTNGEYCNLCVRNKTKYFARDSIGAVYSLYPLKIIRFSENSRRYFIRNSVKGLFHFSCFGDTKIRTINIPESVETIGKHCFQSSSIESITFSPFSHLSIIYDFAFEGTKLVEISFPKSLKSIEERAFANCELLRCIKFHKESCLEFIGDWSFEGTLLKEIDFPTSLKEIGLHAFKNCRLIESLSFSDDSKLVIVASSSFQHCNSIKEISCPNRLIKILRNDKQLDTFFDACGSDDEPHEINYDFLISSSDFESNENSPAMNQSESSIDSYDDYEYNECRMCSLNRNRNRRDYSNSDYFSDRSRDYSAFNSDFE